MFSLLGDGDLCLLGSLVTAVKNGELLEKALKPGDSIGGLLDALFPL